MQQTLCRGLTTEPAIRLANQVLPRTTALATNLLPIVLSTGTSKELRIYKVLSRHPIFDRSPDRQKNTLIAISPATNCAPVWKAVLSRKYRNLSCQDGLGTS